MRMDRWKRPLLDSAMTILFLLLMADRYTGNAAHEWLGMFLVLLVALHTYENRRWYGLLVRRAGMGPRCPRFVVNTLLLAAFAGTIASAVPISKTVWASLGLRGELFARSTHLFFANWCFLLAAAHTGLYGKQIANALRRVFSISGVEGRSSAPRIPPVLRAFTGFASLAATVYGLSVFFRRELFYPLTLRSAFPVWMPGENPILFMIDYVCLFYGCALTSSRLARLLRSDSKPGQQRSIAVTTATRSHSSLEQ